MVGEMLAGNVTGCPFRVKRMGPGVVAMWSIPAG